MIKAIVKGTLYCLMLIACFLFFTGCSVKPCKVKNTDKYVKKLTYFRDEAGLCYTIVAIKRGGWFSFSQQGIGLTCVPCDSLENAGLIEKIKKE